MSFSHKKRSNSKNVMTESVGNGALVLYHLDGSVNSQILAQKFSPKSSSILNDEIVQF